MQDIVNLIVQNGLAVVIVGYFIFKDYKFNGQLVELMGNVNITLQLLREEFIPNKE